MATQINPSRRAFIGAAVAAPAIIAAGGAAAFATAATAAKAEKGAEWSALKRQLDDIRAERALHGKEMDRAFREFEAIRPDLKEVIDWNELGLPFTVNPDKTARTMDVEAEWKRTVEGRGKWWFTRDADGEAGARAFLAKRRKALDSILEFRRLEAEADQKSGCAAAEAKDEALVDREWELEKQLLKLPAPDAEALLWKLEHLVGIDSDPGREYSDSLPMDQAREVLSDARRLLANGRA